MTNKKTKTISGNLVAGSAVMSGVVTASPAVITEAIQKKTEIPPNARESINDFITETFNELWKTFDELININPPAALIEYWDIVLQVIQSFM